MEPFCGPECRSQTLSIQATLCTAIATLIVVVLTFPFSISFNVLFKQNNLENEINILFMHHVYHKDCLETKINNTLRSVFHAEILKLTFKMFVFYHLWSDWCTDQLSRLRTMHSAAWWNSNNQSFSPIHISSITFPLRCNENACCLNHKDYVNDN